MSWIPGVWDGASMLEAPAEIREPLQALHDGLVARRIAHADVAFGSKGGSRHDRDLFPLEERPAELQRAKPEARYVGKQVKGAVGEDARNARDPREPGVEQAPAPVEGGEHHVQRRLRLFPFPQGGKRAVLRERRRVRAHLALELRGGLRDWGR